MASEIAVLASRRRNRRGGGGDASFSFNITNENTFEIDGATGAVTVTVTEPEVYADYDAGNGAGIFSFDIEGLAGGPIDLVPPQIIDDGTPAVGETLTLTPALWIYDPDNGGIGTPTYQWQRDAIDIPDADSNSHIIVIADDGTNLRVLESLTDDAGTSVSPSAAVAIGSAPTDAINSITADTSGIIIDYDGTLTMTGSTVGIELETT